MAPKTQLSAHDFRRRGMRISIPTFSNYLDAVKFAFGEDYFNDLNRRIARRRELHFEFINRSRKATTKALKAMWKNLSKGHLYQLEKLENRRRWSRVLFFGGYFVFISLTAIAAVSLLKWFD